MRFEFDRAKSEALRRNPERRLGFEESLELWEGPHYVDQRGDDPLQWRVIGWVRGSLIPVIFEDRTDEEGEVTRLVTLWRSTKEERRLYEDHR